MFPFQSVYAISSFCLYYSYCFYCNHPPGSCTQLDSTGWIQYKCPLYLSHQHTLTGIFLIIPKLTGDNSFTSLNIDVLQHRSLYNPEYRVQSYYSLSEISLHSGSNLDIKSTTGKMAFVS